MAKHHTKLSMAEKEKELRSEIAQLKEVVRTQGVYIGDRQQVIDILKQSNQDLAKDLKFERIISATATLGFIITILCIIFI